MRRWLKIAGLLLIGVLIILQFFQPEKNAGASTDDDLIKVLSVPDSTALLLTSSCYDCHSNQTVYPWYSRISPVSWYLSKHIELGKEELNFNEYGALEKSKQVGMLSDICEVIESEAMPLKSYGLIHRDARLDKGQIEALCSWADREVMGLLKK